jgi:hypothetical protein
MLANQFLRHCLQALMHCMYKYSLLLVSNLHE